MLFSKLLRRISRIGTHPDGVARIGSHLPVSLSCINTFKQFMPFMVRSTADYRLLYVRAHIGRKVLRHRGQEQTGACDRNRPYAAIMRLIDRMGSRTESVTSRTNPPINRIRTGSRTANERVTYRSHCSR